MQPISYTNFHRSNNPPFVQMGRSVVCPLKKSLTAKQVSFSGQDLKSSNIIELPGISQTKFKAEVIQSEKHLPELVDFIEKMFNGLSNGTTKREYIESYKKNIAKGAYICAIRNNKSKQIIATGTLKHDGYIYSICVHPEHRRQNIARSIMKQLIQEAQSKGLKKVYLTAENPHAISLYQSLGFKTQSKTGNNEQEMCLKLRHSKISTFFAKCYSSFKSLLSKIFSKIK